MDTITCILAASEVPSIDLMGEVPVLLSNITQQFNEYGRLVKGRCGEHMFVCVREEDVRVRVSLPKLLRGHSLWNMGISDVMDSIIMASDMLHLPMERAEVRKFDYAGNLEMVYAPELYMRYLGANGRFKRLENPGSLCYSLPSINLNLYNKSREMKAHHDPIPREYQGLNILRYEKGYVKQVAKYFKKDKIKAAMLYDPSFYQTIRKDWYKDYTAIKKIRKPMIDFSSVTTKKQLYSMAIVALVDNYGGVQKMLLDLDEGRKTGKLKRKQSFDLKDAITAASNDKLFTRECELITELDMKMAEAMAIETNNKFRSNGMEDYNWYPGI